MKVFTGLTLAKLIQSLGSYNAADRHTDRYIDIQNTDKQYTDIQIHILNL